jgi:hypothetical protein
MITQRFRPLFWVAGVGIAATALYTVSSQVANERSRLQSLEEKIGMTKRDIRQLQTELGTRGSLRQLERWNGEALSLVAPGATQFLPDETALSKVDGAILVPGKYVPAPVMVSAATPVADEAASAKADAPSAENVSGQGAQQQTKAQRVAVLEETLTGGSAQSLQPVSAKPSRTAPKPKGKGQPLP